MTPRPAASRARRLASLLAVPVVAAGLTAGALFTASCRDEAKDDPGAESATDEPADEPAGDEPESLGPMDEVPPAPKAPGPRPPVAPPVQVPVPPAPEPAPKEEEPAGPPESVESAGQRIADLFARVGPAPPSAQGLTDPAKLAAFSKAMDARDADLAALSKATESYMRAAGSEGGQPLVLFYGGAGKAWRADRLSSDQAQAERLRAVELLRRALGGASADASYRAQAEDTLGRTMLLLVSSGHAQLEEAVEHLRAAATAYAREGSHEAAGAAAAVALQRLVAEGRDADARAFAGAIDAGRADFGKMTDIVRTLVRRADTGLGTTLPALPDVTDVDGKPIRWAGFRGAPLVIHFFHAGWITGRSADEKDVADVLRPLHDRLGPRGLRMVGVSMDWAIPPEKVAKIRADWDEWGRKEKVQDGSLASVRAVAEEQGIDWPWYWDGAYSKNPISLALGGCGTSNPHAVLVDAEGIVRWRGDAPFQGLAEAADALMK